MGERGWLKLEASSLPALGEGWAGAPQGSQETPSALRFLGHHRTGLALGWCVLQQRSRVVRVLWAQGCAEGGWEDGNWSPQGGRSSPWALLLGLCHVPLPLNLCPAWVWPLLLTGSGSMVGGVHPPGWGSQAWPGVGCPSPQLHCHLWGGAGHPLTQGVLCCPLTSLQYVRLSLDTPPSVIYHLMTQYWGLDVPNLLISVTGGAKDFNMKPRLKSVFRRGLVKVAQTTGSTWGWEPWWAEQTAPGCWDWSGSQGSPRPCPPRSDSPSPCWPAAAAAWLAHGTDIALASCWERHPALQPQAA